MVGKNDDKSFIVSLCDYIEKSALGFSICGFGTFVFLMYFTNMLLDERLLSSILLGGGLAGLIVGVFFWIRRHANNKAAQEREMFLSFKGDEKVWRFKLTFNNVIVIMGEFWTLGQLLFFGSHTGPSPFPDVHLDFDRIFRVTVLRFEFNYFILFGFSIFVVAVLSFFFFFGFAVHKIAGYCCSGNSRRGAIKLKNLKKGDEDLEANKRRKKEQDDGAPAWNSFKRFILQITSVFYVGIFTQILTALACVWDDSTPPRAYLMRDPKVECFTGVHSFIATLAILVAFFLFPLNTYLLTISTQPPIKSDNGEIIFIRDATLTFVLAELMCSALKLFYGQPKYRQHYLFMVAIVYLALIIFMIYGRLTKRPACNSRGMFYLKLAIIFAALAYNIASILADIQPSRADVIQKGLTYAAWPLIGAVFLIWLLSVGRRGYPAFIFTIDVEAILKNKGIGICLAVDNDSQNPSRYQRMEMMIIFDPVGTPWYGVLLLLTIARKRWVLATRFHPDTGPEYRNAAIMPASHLTDPIDIEKLDMEKLAQEVFIRYVRKDLRKLFKSLGGEQYNLAKRNLTLNEMFEICYQEFAKNKNEQRLLKINYPHLAVYMLERFCREQPHDQIVVFLTTTNNNGSGITASVSS